MSFSFNAVGTAEEAAAQLAAVKTDNVIGQQLAETLAMLLGDPANHGAPYAGGSLRYIVKAYGHSGSGSPVSLQASVEALWIPDVPAAAESEQDGQGDEQAAASDPGPED